MPREEVHQETGAILFKQTEEEKALERIEAKVDQINYNLDYVTRFLRRYEPVFEKMLDQSIESNEKAT